MQTLDSYLSGTWAAGNGDPQRLVNPATEEVIAQTSAEGLAVEDGLQFARSEAGPALRSMTFAERGALLSAMANCIHEHRDELLEVAMRNGGNTRGDAKFDVDGASATLAHYAELGKELGDVPVLPDGDSVQLGLSPKFAGRHVFVPRRGVALLINAFNFPAWGFGEKAACALLAGMPVVVKPATSSAQVVERMVKHLAPLLPKGALNLVCGSAHHLPGLLDYGDVIAFTGSSATGRKLATLSSVLSGAVRLNIEADSLNAAVLGPDIDSDSPTYDAFIRSVTREMTQKSGQKCTAIRRVFVGADQRDGVVEDLIERLSATIVGDPFSKGVRMGPLASSQQLRDVRAGIASLREGCGMLLGEAAVKPQGVAEGKGYFVAPTLLECSDPEFAAVHDLEVFGPVATLIKAPTDPAAVGALLARGRGSLVCSVYSDDRRYATALLHSGAVHHGRMAFVSKRVAESAPSPGMVMPQLQHGGPGRAGGGEELGGVRGLAFYMQRVALQGARPLLDSMLKAR